MTTAWLEQALARLWTALPRDKAMAALVVKQPVAGLTSVVDACLKEASLSGKPLVEAGLWLYVDDLERCHRFAQAHEGEPSFDYCHAIMHRREGDFSNSRYWLRRVGTHPLLDREGYDAMRLVHEIEAAHARGEAPLGLVAQQRSEWEALFAYATRG